MNAMNNDTNNDRPTPITDAATFIIPRHGADGTGSRVAVVPYQVASDLERHLAEARYQRDTLAEAVEQLMTYRPNGLSGEDQHEIAVWREVVDALAAVKGGTRE